MLICGVGGGIGAAVIKYLIDRSKILISSSHLDISTLQKQDIIPGNYIHIPLNPTQENNITSLFKVFKQKIGRLYVLIRTIVGSLYIDPIVDFPLVEFEETLKINLTTAFLLTKYAFRVMKANKPRGENIVHFIFSSVRKISPHKVPYGITKMGLAKPVNYIATEVGNHDIRVNGISPGYVFTDRHIQEIELKVKSAYKTEEDVAQSKMKLQQINRTLNPEDLLLLVESLSTTKVITGQNYNCTVGEVLNY